MPTVLVSYPSDLPCPQRLGFEPVDRRAVSDASRPREARARQRDRLAIEEVAFRPFSAAESAQFAAWWRNDLSFGSAWFNASWPGPRGIVAAVRRFIGAPTWTFIPGGFWRVDARFEVRGESLPVLVETTPPPSNLLEDFELGNLSLYSTIVGDSSDWQVTQTNAWDGFSLYIPPGAYPPTTIRRDFAARTVHEISFMVRVDTYGGSWQDDACSIAIYDSAGGPAAAYVQLLPYREAFFDAARRPLLSIGGNVWLTGTSSSYCGSAALTLDEWYRFTMSIVIGTNTSSWSIIKESDSSVHSSGVFSALALPTVNALGFDEDIAPGYFGFPVRYDDIDAVEP